MEHEWFAAAYSIRSLTLSCISLFVELSKAILGHHEHDFQKRLLRGAYMQSCDFFLSHNSKDKPIVKEVAMALQQRGVLVWLDDWALRPGMDWQSELERAIQSCKAAGICFGANGIGPWVEPEMRAILIRFVDEKCNGSSMPVIPIMLPNFQETQQLPMFLRSFTWVDLRPKISEENIDRLEWGITGRRPDRGGAAPNDH
ncbi:MAG: toll/interleukin-1 receptor domain-containing protein [Planctomycetota bacterium]